MVCNYGVFTQLCYICVHCHMLYKNISFLIDIVHV